MKVPDAAPLFSTLRCAGVALGLALAAAAASAQTGVPGPATNGRVAVLDIEGAIGPATTDYLTRGFERATSRGAGAIVLRMDTPGGLSSAMRDIIRTIIASPVPVIGYVAPGGAHAASAGTYILYATHIAAMAPGTNLGAATPIQLRPPIPGLGGGPAKDKPAKDKATPPGENGETEPPAAEPETGDAAASKAVNDARAYIRSLAQLRGRNVEWAERAVTHAATLSAEDALREKVIDLIAASLPELLASIDGRTVTIDKREVTLKTRGAAIEVIAPDLRVRFLSVITDPNIAYILLLVGIYGLILEFYSPGIVFSGVIGAICLMLALYSLHVLPVNYAGLGLILLGVAFMVAEAFVPAFGVLGIGGIVSLVIGSIILIDTDAPGFAISWTIIGSVAAASAILTFSIIAFAARAWHRPVVSGREGMIGARGRVVNWDNGTGRVRIHGEIWRARADRPLASGQEVTVRQIDGLVLVVEPPQAAEPNEGARHGHHA